MATLSILRDLAKFRLFSIFAESLMATLSILRDLASHEHVGKAQFLEKDSNLGYFEHNASKYFQLVEKDIVTGGSYSIGELRNHN